MLLWILGGFEITESILEITESIRYVYCVGLEKYMLLWILGGSLRVSSKYAVVGTCGV